MQRQLAFFVDTTRCINCRTCEAACRDFNQTTLARRLRRVRSFEGGGFPSVFAFAVSISCNHCQDPMCVKHCPAGAYTKREADGIVVHSPDRCIGCRYCTWLCPYGAPQYDPAEGYVRKCNLCVEEIDQGRPPACVSSCPLRAIEVGYLDEISVKQGATSEVRGLPSARITNPSCRFRLRGEAQHV